MSQNTNLSTMNDTSTDVLNNNNDHWKSTSDINVVNNNNNNDWANFDTFENNTNYNIEEITSVTDSNDDDWADFQSNTENSVELSNDQKSEKENHQFDEIQISSLLSMNSFDMNQIDKLISICFPLESPILSTDTNSSISFELPTLTTFNDPMKNLQSLQPCLSLWNALSNIPNDPIGVRYQWHKSNVEHSFHQALGFDKQLSNKTTSTINSSTDDCKQTNLGNPFLDPLNPFETDDDLFDVSTTLDVDYYIPSKLNVSSNADTMMNSSSTIRQNDSSISKQISTPIKTTDLFPGSTTMVNDESKFVLNSPSNLTFINPKALMSSIQITHESTM